MSKDDLPGPRPVVFAKTRHHYPSYEDFWRLVEVAGFPVKHVDEIDLTSQAVWITTPWNGETEPAIKAARERAGKKPEGKVVWWNLERDLADAEPEDRAARLGPASKLVDAIWVSDRYYASLDDRFDFVVLGGHPRLPPPRACLLYPREVYDATLYAYVWGRRQAIAEAFALAGMRLAPPAWTLEDRARVLIGTPVMVNTHQQDNAAIVAPIRFAVAASYGMALVSEPVADPSPLVEGEHFVSTPVEQLPAMADSMTAPVGHVFAEQLYTLLVEEHRFDLSVQRAVAALED